MRKPRRILVVEDYLPLAETIRSGLGRKLQARVEVETSGMTAVRRILDEKPDVVLLDLGLPDMPGLEVLRQVKPRYQGHVLVITGEKSEEARAEAHRAGAVHWIQKPIGIDALAAQLQAVLSASPAPPEQAPAEIEPAEIELDGLTLVRMTGGARLRGAPLHLGPKQFAVLWVLARQAGSPVHRETLCLVLGRTDWSKDDRAVDMLVHELRQKLGDESGAWLVSLRGEGYLLRPRSSGGAKTTSTLTRS